MGVWDNLLKLAMPNPNKKGLLRLLLVAGAAWLFFGYLCLPMKIRGHSMDPTYRDGAFNFCWRLSYAFSPPRPGDVVVVRMAGRRVMLLKRVVATEGQTVAFEEGRLVVDEMEVDEPYLQGSSNWELAPRTVKPGFVYLVGDNRSVAMERHDFGQTPVTRIMGAPLW